MSAFFYIAGVVVTILGVLAIAVISGVYVAVRFFGVVLTFGSFKSKNNDTEL